MLLRMARIRVRSCPEVGCINKREVGVDKEVVFVVHSASKMGSHCLDLCEG